MRFPDFDLPAADGGRLRRDDLLGAPWVAYLARHPGCFVCQARLAAALERRAEIRARGGDVVLFFNAGVAYTTTWVERAKASGDLPADLRVAMDPDAALYRELGTVRGRVLDEVGQTLGSLWRARGHVRRWRLTRNDMLRMGADVVVAADGTILLRHLCRNPEDRAAPSRLVAALA